MSPEKSPLREWRLTGDAASLPAGGHDTVPGRCFGGTGLGLDRAGWRGAADEGIVAMRRRAGDRAGSVDDRAMRGGGSDVFAGRSPTAPWITASGPEVTRRASVGGSPHAPQLLRRRRTFLRRSALFGWLPGRLLGDGTKALGHQIHVFTPELIASPEMVVPSTA